MFRQRHVQSDCGSQLANKQKTADNIHWLGDNLGVQNKLQQAGIAGCVILFVTRRNRGKHA
jgi:hypothetical protein